MHIPVLKKEVLEYLDPQRNENFIDCTLGEGGHAFAVLERTGPKGKVLAVDATRCLVDKFKKKIGNGKISKRLVPVCSSFNELEKIVEEKDFKDIKGILFDLGMSSWHIEESKRGFSFMANEPLDMRYSLENSLTAEKILNQYSLEEIKKILKDYGEERFAERIARQIVKERKTKPFGTTFELREAIRRATPYHYHRRKIHFATRTFQALRIAVNDELNKIKQALTQSFKVLSPGGRVVVISFHSLEDRIVKNLFKEQSKEGFFKILTKKPIRPLQEEIESNRRARSAKLRAILKI